MGYKYSDEELLEALKRKRDELGRRPTQKEIKNDKSMPGATTYHDRLGGLERAWDIIEGEIEQSKESKVNENVSKTEVVKEMIRHMMIDLGYI